MSLVSCSECIKDSSGLQCFPAVIKAQALIDTAALPGSKSVAFGNTPLRKAAALVRTKCKAWRSRGSKCRSKWGSFGVMSRPQGAHGQVVAVLLNALGNLMIGSLFLPHFL